MSEIAPGGLQVQAHDALLKLQHRLMALYSAWDERPPFQEIEQFADALAQDTDQTKPPLNLFLAGAAMGVKEWRRLTSFAGHPAGCEGLLEPTSTGFAVSTRETFNPLTERFSIAHEVAHSVFYVHGTRPPSPLVQVRNLKERKWQEQICEELARRILMPRSFVENFWAATSSEAIQGVEGLLQFHRDFAVNMEPACRRMFWDFDAWPNAAVFRYRKFPKGLLPVSSFRGSRLPTRITRSSILDAVSLFVGKRIPLETIRRRVRTGAFEIVLEIHPESDSRLTVFCEKLGD